MHHGLCAMLDAVPAHECHDLDWQRLFQLVPHQTLSVCIWFDWPGNSDSEKKAIELVLEKEGCLNTCNIYKLNLKQYE